MKRFFEKTKNDGECVMWTAHTDKNGYGIFWLDGKNHRAHRVAWFLATGEMPPDDMLVCHTCDTPGCVNPAHLFIGTHKDNQRDKWRKGRAVPIPTEARVRGEKQHDARLTQHDVKAIRLYSQSVNRNKLAAIFGVSWTSINKIIKRQTWAHVK